MQAANPAVRRRQTQGDGALGRAIRYLRNHPRATFLAYAALVIATLAQLIVPQLLKNMIDAITSGSMVHLPALQRGVYMLSTGLTQADLEAQNASAETLLLNIVLLILVFAVVRGLFSFVQAYASESVSQGIAYDLRNEIFAKIQRLSFSYYDRTQTGQLMIRATDDVEKLRLFIAQGLVLAVGAFLLLGATLLILFLINWKLTLVILPILPLSLFLFFMFGRISQPLFGELQRRLSTLNTILQENVAGIRVVKAFVSEVREQARFDRAALDLFAQALKISAVFAILFPLINLIAQFGQGGLLYFGGLEILGDNLSLGDYQQFTLYVIYIFLPV